MLRLLYVVVFIVPAFGAKHYSYAGRASSRWTVSDVPQDAAASTRPPNYTAYSGGSAMKTDAAGNSYVVGKRPQPGSPTKGLVVYDAFVSKLDPAGNLVFTVSISGKKDDLANDLALDGEGNIYVVGATYSPDFPLVKPYQSVWREQGYVSNYWSTGFILKLSADGSRLLYSSYFGGAQEHSGVGTVALDSSGNIYVAGQTVSPDFTSTAGMPSAIMTVGYAEHTPAFVAKLTPAGDRVLYSGLIGGGHVPCGSTSSCMLTDKYTSISSLALDAAGNLYFGGSTNTSDLKTTTGVLHPEGVGPFVGAVKADGSGLLYLTYIGTKYTAEVDRVYPADSLCDLTVDSAGNAYIVGATSDTAFPVSPGAYRAKNQPSTGGFVAKLNPSGTAFVWATHVGDSAYSVALDATGNVWISGYTESPDFPNINGGLTSAVGFLAALNATGSRLVYSARLGAALGSIGFDGLGGIHLIGSGIVSVLPSGQLVGPRLYSIVNAAFGYASGVIVPGEIISITGWFGVPNPAGAKVDASGLLPKSLAGVQVSIAGIPAPLLYVSDTLINAVVPFGATASTSRVEVTVNGEVLPVFHAARAVAAPEIFKNPDGSAAALNEDGTLNSQSNPAAPGSIMTVWVTGVVPFQNTDGEIQKGADDSADCGVNGYGPGALEVLYAGAAPGLVTGTVQINFRLPPPNRPQEQPSWIEVTSGGQASVSAWISVKKANN